MEYLKEILVKDYFEIQKHYEEIYGRTRTLILIQVGSFHECYGTDEDGIDLINLSQTLNIVCTKKNSNLPISKTNPRMLGFPIYVTQNYIDKLIELNYTVILIDQVTDPPQPKRQITNIYSPGTYINKKINNNLYLVSIVLDKIKDIKTNNNLICIGLTAYDLTTGSGSIYETYSNINDILLGLDDALRFLEKYPPREIILKNNLLETEILLNMSVKDILLYLNIEENNTYKIKIRDHEKIEYQRNILKKIYNIESNIDIIEFLGLQFYNWSRLSLILLLDYVSNHQIRLLEKLKIPEHYESNKYLYLGNRSLEQLDVFTKNSNINLLNIINYTKTAMGKRFLITQLTSPLIEIELLNKRYNIIEEIVKKNKEKEINNYLEDIYDIEKIIRKIEINMINPYELNQLYISFYQINKLFKYLETNELIKLFEIKENIKQEVNNILEHIKIRYDLNLINDLNFNNYTETENNFYNKFQYEELDKLQGKIESSQNFLENLIKKLESYIIDEKKRNIDKTLITIKNNDKDGYYLLITNKRCEILKKNLKNVNILNIDNILIETKDLIFTELTKSQNTKISCNKIKNLSDNLSEYKKDLAKLLKEYFYNDMKEFYNKYNKTLYIISNYISYIDFINSGALCAITNHYTKPIIKKKIKSYFKTKELRHPIVEKINNNSNYITHNIELGYETEQNGILLYGINSSGKSTLMKSIGLNIIMAQIGYYTSSSYFEFSPYKSLFTRISGNDNMFKGLSSFMVEMMELMAILKRNNSNTLVIGDEICRGTEEKSANIIVCYMLEKLSLSDSSFITATHLHRIAEMESVKNIKNIKCKHLKLSYDSTTDLLIYDRQLLDGQGETFYGLQVAKYLMKDKKFNERTQEILNEYDNKSVKTSKYNNKLYLDNCEICKTCKNLETHHIVWQKEFDINNINNNKFYLQKNDKCNLVTLCCSCHDKVDKNEIIINGWKETSNGIKFEYKENNNINKKSKYSEEIINYIYKLKKKYYNDEKMARIKIKEKFNRRISTKTIITLWKNSIEPKTD